MRIAILYGLGETFWNTLLLWAVIIIPLCLLVLAVGYATQFGNYDIGVYPLRIFLPFFLVSVTGLALAQLAAQMHQVIDRHT